MEEQEMIKLLKNGDERGISLLIQIYGRYVAAIIANIGRGGLNQEDIEEIAADVFVALWQHREDLRKDTTVKPYLAQIARNKTISFQRKNHLEYVFDDDSIYYAKTGCPDVEMEKAEKKRIINEAVAAMEQPEQEIFVRFYYFGEQIQTIAQKLSLNPATIKTKLHRARKKLRGVFEERGYQYEEG